MSILTPFEIAHQDARRLAIVLSEIGGDGSPIDSGWMACDQSGSWANYAAGLGLQGPVDESILDTLVNFYRGRNRLPRIQITPYQHPTLLKGLATRKFVFNELETVLFRTLNHLPSVESFSQFSFHRIDPLNPEDVLAFRTSQMTGFFDNQEPPAGMLPITDRVARSPRTQLWLIKLEGQIVGSGGLEIFEQSGVLIAGCVHAKARNQGIQLAFIKFRLQQAAIMGLNYVTIGSIPEKTTERNALRAGFSVAYTQLELQQV